MSGKVIIVIFGATGDLNRRKLFPSIFRLFNEGLLPKDIHIVGLATRELDTAGFLEMMATAPEEAQVLAENKTQWEDFSRHVSYISGNFLEHETYEALSMRLAELAGTESFSALNLLFLHRHNTKHLSCYPGKPG